MIQSWNIRVYKNCIFIKRINGEELLSAVLLLFLKVTEIIISVIIMKLIYKKTAAILDNMNDSPILFLSYSS
jgi:hypothetical protein